LEHTKDFYSRSSSDKFLHKNLNKEGFFVVANVTVKWKKKKKKKKKTEKIVYVMMMMIL